MKNQWQNNLRNRMERHEEPAPEGLWNRIEQAMSAESMPAVPAKRNIPLWGLRIGTVAAAALILFYIGIHTLNPKKSREDMQATEQQLKEYLAPGSHHSPKAPTTVKTKEQLLVHGTEVVKSVESVSKTEKTGTAAEVDEPAESLPENEQLRQNESGAGKELPSQHQGGDDRQQYVVEKNDETAFKLPESRRQRKLPKWQTDVYASNIPSGAVNKHSGYDSFRPYEFPSEDEEYVVAAIRSDLPEEISVLNEYQHVYSDIKHYQPISLGVSAKYNFNERWSLASGLTYTILSSQLHSGTGNHYYNSQQTLHFIGIPLNVNYTVWQNDKISAYISGGGLVEKNVSGTLSTDVVIDNKLETQSRDKISVKPLQWSVNSAVGIQYKLAKNIGIYAEPGIAYYFKNDSPVETIYKEKPLNFNVRLGLRFSLNE